MSSHHHQPPTHAEIVSSAETAAGERQDTAANSKLDLGKDFNFSKFQHRSAGTVNVLGPHPFQAGSTGKKGYKVVAEQLGAVARSMNRDVAHLTAKVAALHATQSQVASVAAGNWPTVNDFAAASGDTTNNISAFCDQLRAFHTEIVSTLKKVAENYHETEAFNQALNGKVNVSSSGKVTPVKAK